LLSPLLQGTEEETWARKLCLRLLFWQAKVSRWWFGVWRWSDQTRA